MTQANEHSEFYNAVEYARAIIDEWDNDIFKINENGRKKILTDHYWAQNFGVNVTYADAFSTAVSNFRKNVGIIHRLEPLKGTLGVAMTIAKAQELLLGSAMDIAELKDKLKANDCMSEGTKTKEKLKRYDDAIESAEKAEARAEKAERERDQALLELSQSNDAFNRLAAKIRKDVPYADKYIEEALASNPDTIKSSLEEVDGEDDNV